MEKSVHTLSSSLCLWVVLFLAFGYPIQAGLPILLNQDPGLWNMIFRAAYALILVVLLLIRLTSKKQKVNYSSIGLYALIVFWFIYLIRLVFDLGFMNDRFAHRSEFWVFSMALGNGFLPIVTITAFLKDLDLKKFLQFSYYIIIASNVLIIAIVLVQNSSGLTLDLFNTRVSVTGEDEDMLVINTILIGTFGNLLASYSLFGLLNTDKKRGQKQVFLITFVLGVFVMIMAASRGPILYFLLVTLINTAYYIYRQGRKDFYKPMLKIGIFSFSLILVVNSFSFNTEEFSMFRRVENFIEARQNSEKEERDYEWASAWTQFQDAPVFGDRFLNNYDNYYPHNLILEVLMATGVAGAFPFFFFLILFVRNVVSAFKYKLDHQAHTNVLILCIVFSTFTSGGLFTISYFWALVPLAFKR